MFFVKVVFKDEQEFFDFNRSAIVSKHSFKQCPEMYTRFLESLFESQTYPNENESDPLGTDVSRLIHSLQYFYSLTFELLERYLIPIT